MLAVDIKSSNVVTDDPRRSSTFSHKAIFELSSDSLADFVDGDG